MLLLWGCQFAPAVLQTQPGGEEAGWQLSPPHLPPGGSSRGLLYSLAEVEPGSGAGAGAGSGRQEALPGGS